MNGYQVCVALFAAFVIAVSLWSIVVVVRSPAFRFKPLWIIGCLAGFVGLGLDWTYPGDLIILVGVTIPVVMVLKTVTGHVLVKTGLPIVAAVALSKARAVGAAR